MPYVRVGTKRRIFLTLAVLNALVSTALLPAAFASSQWLSETLSSRTISSATLSTVDATQLTTYGLLNNCRYTSYESKCSKAEWNLPQSSVFVGCMRSTSDFSQRMNAALTLLIFAFILSVPNCASSIYQFFTSMSVGRNSENRRFYFILQVVSSILSLIATLAALAIYGHTYNTWLGCGQSFCSAQVVWYRSTLQVKQAAQFPNTSQDFLVDCGYGLSLGFAVASMLSTLTYLALAAYNRSAPVPPPMSPPTSGATELKRGAAKEPTGEDSPVRLVPEGPDWEFDESTQLYWSPSQELFFDPTSGHFYDGATECWYDPNEKRWYKL